MTPRDLAGARQHHPAVDQGERLLRDDRLMATVALGHIRRVEHGQERDIVAAGITVVNRPARPGLGDGDGLFGSADLGVKAAGQEQHAVADDLALHPFEIRRATGNDCRGRF